MGKAKPTKHTSAELAGKAFNATVNRGGGQAGLQDRKGGKAGHAKYKCAVTAALCLSCVPPSTTALWRHLRRAALTLAHPCRCHVCGQQAPDLKTMQVRSGLCVWSSSPRRQLHKTVCDADSALRPHRAATL